MSKRTQQRRKQWLQRVRPYPREIYRGANFFLWLEERGAEELERIFKGKLTQHELTHILTKYAYTCENNSVKFWSYCSLENKAILVNAYYQNTNREQGVSPTSATSPNYTLRYNVAILRRGNKRARLYRDFHLPVYDNHDTVQDAIEWFNLIHSSGTTIDVRRIVGLFWRLLSTDTTDSHLPVKKSQSYGEAAQLHTKLPNISNLILLVELEAGSTVEE